MELRFDWVLYSKLGNEILTQAISNVFSFLFFYQIYFLVFRL